MFWKKTDSYEHCLLPFFNMNKVLMPACIGTEMFYRFLAISLKVP